MRAVAPKPVNVVVGPRSGPVPLADLSAAGVRRVSLGGSLYMGTMAALVRHRRTVRAGNLAAAVPGIRSADIAALLPAP